MQAVSARARAAERAPPASRRRRRGCRVIGVLLVTGRAVPGLAWCRTVSKTSSRVAARAVCRAPVRTGCLADGGELEAGRVAASEPSSSAIWSRRRSPPAVRSRRRARPASGSTTATTDGDADGEPLAERGEQLVAGARACRGPVRDGRRRAAGAEPERAGQREHRRCRRPAPGSRRRCRGVRRAPAACRAAAGSRPRRRRRWRRRGPGRRSRWRRRAPRPPRAARSPRRPGRTPTAARRRRPG